MNRDLEIAKDIAASMAGGFGGDGRIAVVAMKNLYEKLKSVESADAKEIAHDLMVAMGPDFEGNVNRAVEALDKILGSMVVKKKAGPGQPGAQAGEIEVTDK
jgi:hypothetical protein